MTEPELELCWGTGSAPTVPALIDAAAAGGFGAITVTPWLRATSLERGHGDQEIRRRLDDNGVRISYLDGLVGVLPGAPRPDEVDEAFRSMFAYGEEDGYRAAEALGTSMINVAPFLGRVVADAELMDGFAALCERAAARGFRVALEFIPDTGVPDLATACRLVAGTSGRQAGVLLDTWHHARSGGGADEVAELAPGTLAGLQLSDRVAPAPGAGYVAMAGRLLPGDGDLPLAAIMASVRRSDPEVALGVEVFSDELRAMPPSEAARLAAASLRRLLLQLDPAG